MAKGPARPRPLPTVLAALDYTNPGLILVKGRKYFRIRDVTNAARRAAKSGPRETQSFLNAFVFWEERDSEGKVVIMRQTPAGPRPFAVEDGSRLVSWTLDEGELGPESSLSGPYEDEGIEMGVKGFRKSRGLPPEHRQLREGFWRLIQRIHRGIPGIKGTGEVNNGQFTGGTAGIKTAWVVKPHGTSSMIDSIAIAGFYAFGQYWPHVIKLAGMPNNASDIIRKLEQEFGLSSDRDLEQGTVPNPDARASMGKPAETSSETMTKGAQFETALDGTRFIVVYTKHFVDRYTYDEGTRPAVARFMSPDMVREEIEKALSQIKDMIENDPYSQGIIVSKPYGLSMKFAPTPIDDGWQLTFVTQIIALPLWRTSDREVEIVVNPVVDVRFDDYVPEDLQITLLADLAPRFMELGPGEEEELSGELVSAVIRHGVDGFSVRDVEWKEAWEPLYV